MLASPTRCARAGRFLFCLLVVCLFPVVLLCAFELASREAAPPERGSFWLPLLRCCHHSTLVDTTTPHPEHNRAPRDHAPKSHESLRLNGFLEGFR
ncbi:hypothetical protein L209DRAFT_752007 [Thermothelomyces heterothallicus CBS 203.75]